MSIYHLTTKNIGRSDGRSATASAAYRAAEKIVDARQDMTFNYTSRTQSVDHTEILCPDHSPSFCSSRSELWNAVEASEKRKDARVAREVEIALPRELSKEQNVELARDFVKSSFVDRGMVADLCIHDVHGDNPHAHVLLTTRHISPDGFGNKNREWNKDELLENWRQEWEDSCNKHLELNGYEERIDHRTLEAQGIDRIPQKHLGVEATAIERRTGEKSHLRSRHEELANELENKNKSFNPREYLRKLAQDSIKNNEKISYLEPVQTQENKEPEKFNARAYLEAIRQSAIEKKPPIQEETLKPTSEKTITGYYERMKGVYIRPYLECKENNPYKNTEIMQITEVTEKEDGSATFRCESLGKNSIHIQISKDELHGYFEKISRQEVRNLNLPNLLEEREPLFSKEELQEMREQEKSKNQSLENDKGFEIGD